MPPVGRVDITAADAVGSAPITAIELPANGGKPLAEDWQNVAAMALKNDAYRGTAIDGKVAKAGDTMTGVLTLNAGATVASGQVLALNGASVTGVVGFSTLGRVWLAGRKQMWRRRVILADAAQTVSVDQGDRFVLSATNVSRRIIELDSTTYVPQEGETLTFFWNPGTAGGAGLQYTFKRDTGAGAATIATFVGAQVADTGAVYAEFEYALISTGPNVYAWRLGEHSGTPNEYTGPTPGPEAWTSYGVVPGAGA